METRHKFPNGMTVTERPAEDGSFDELLLHNVGLVHVETMDDNTVWIGFTPRDNQTSGWRLVVSSKGKLRYLSEED